MLGLEVSDDGVNECLRLGLPHHVEPAIKNFWRLEIKACNAQCTCKTLLLLTLVSERGGRERSDFLSFGRALVL